MNTLFIFWPDKAIFGGTNWKYLIILNSSIINLAVPVVAAVLCSLTLLMI